MWAFDSRPWGWATVLGPLLVFRGLNALVVRTYFNPDEYWQSVEVAHLMAFDYGLKTWEWQDDSRLRGYAHPFIFAALYKLLAFAGVDSRTCIAVAPRLLQSMFVSIYDLFVYKLARRIFGEVAGKWALFASVVNWFTFYCMIRTYSNSVEAIFSVIAFYYWPWGNGQGDDKKEPERKGVLSDRFVALFFAALACVLRPTNAGIWVWLGVSHLVKTRSALKFIFLEVLPIGALMLGLAAYIDRLYYGEWTFVPYNFVLFNVIKGGSELYGVNFALYYFLEAFPVMLFTFYPVFLLGVKVASKHRELFWVILWTKLFFSINKHKEYRFVLPVLPLAIVYCGRGLSELQSAGWFGKADEPSETKTKKVEVENKPNKNMEGETKANKDKKDEAGAPNPLRGWKRLGRLFMWALLGSNVAMAWYFSLVHQRAPIEVMQYLSERTGCIDDPHGHVKAFDFTCAELKKIVQCEGDLNILDPEKIPVETFLRDVCPATCQSCVESVHFVMGCHSAPYYSLLHAPEGEKRIPLLMFDCSPHDVDGSDQQLTLQNTEASDFNHDPLRFVSEFYHAVTPAYSDTNRRCAKMENKTSCLACTTCAWMSCSSDGAGDLTTDPTGGNSNSKCVTVGLPSQKDIELWCPGQGRIHKPSLEWLWPEGTELASKSGGCSIPATTPVSKAIFHPELGLWTSDRDLDPLWGRNWRKQDELSNNFLGQDATALPSHTVLYDGKTAQVLPWLHAHTLRVRKKIWHAHLSDEGKYMEVYSRWNNS